MSAIDPKVPLENTKDAILCSIVKADNNDRPNKAHKVPAIIEGNIII